MTPPPSSAASFCDAAAILPSLYLATTRVLPRPAVASRLVDAPDAAPPPVYLPHRRVLSLRLPSHLTPHRRVPPPLCYRAAVRPSRLSCQAIAVCCCRALSRLPGIASAVAPHLALSCSAVAPRLALLSRQKLCYKTSSILGCPALLGRRPAHCHRHCRHPAIGPAQPSSRYRLAAICPAVTLLPSLGLPVLPLSAAAPCCLAVAALPCYC